MKQLLKHPSHFMKLVALLLFLSVFNCQKEDINMLNQPQELSSTSYKITSLSKLTKLQTVVENIKKLAPKTNAYNRGFGDFLPLENIDTNMVIQYTDTTGYSTYTFKIESDDETSINFENLYLLETEQGYIGYILRYEPDPEWYNSQLIFQHGEYILDMHGYQGDITKYSFEREVIWSTKEEDLSRTSHSMRGQFITECTISIQMVCKCDVHESGNWYGCLCLEMGEVETCNTVWSGGSGSGDGGNGDGSNNGGGGGNDPCITTGTTIIGQQPISGIGTACTPNEGTGVLIPPYIETTCTLGINVTAYLMDCLEINSFTQMELQNYIENPDNACQVGNMATYLTQNQCSEEAQAFMIETLETLSTYTEISYPGMELDYEFEWWLDDDFILNSGNFDLPSDDLPAFEQPNIKELFLFRLYPAAAILHVENSNVALDKAEELVITGVLTGLTNGKADAFRHAYWNALGTAEFGVSIMKQFADAHEHGESGLDVDMDLFNNHIGRNIGEGFDFFSSESDISNAILQALYNGLLKYINSIGTLVNSNQ